MVSQAGDEGNAVVRGGLEITPVSVGDNLYRLNRIGTGPIDGGVGDSIASLQVLDGADSVLGPPVMAARSDIAVPGGGGAIVPQALFHAGVRLTLPQLHVNFEGRES